MENKNIFEGHFGGIIAFVAVIWFFVAFYLSSSNWGYVWIPMFIVYGGIYFLNYRRTSRPKFLISAIGLFLACVASIVQTFVYQFTMWRVIWIATVVIILLSGPVSALFGDLGWKTEEKIGTIQKT